MKRENKFEGGSPPLNIDFRDFYHCAHKNKNKNIDGQSRRKSKCQLKIIPKKIDRFLGLLPLSSMRSFLKFEI
jgi:hypothetical protein